MSIKRLSKMGSLCSFGVHLTTRSEDNQRTWKPASVKVHAGKGRDPLEIMPFVKNPEDEDEDQGGLIRSDTERPQSAVPNRCVPSPLPNELPAAFWREEGVLLTGDSGTDHSLHIGDHVFMLQTEIGLSRSLRDDKVDITAPRGDDELADALITLSNSVQPSSDVFLYTQSIQRTLCEMVRMVNTPEAEEMLLSEFAKLQQEIKEVILSNLGKKHEFSGSNVSSNIPLETGRTCKRIKSASEQKAPSKETDRKNYPL